MQQQDQGIEENNWLRCTDLIYLFIYFVCYAQQQILPNLIRFWYTGYSSNLVDFYRRLHVD